jgi:tetratricopeptide (TPR) repeat protein
MKSMYRANTRSLTQSILTLALIALFSAPAFAQETETRVVEGQEYKMKYNEALEFAKAKNFNGAYAAFEATVPLAEQAGDSEVAERSLKVLAQIDNIRGTQAFKNENFSEALAHHQKGIEHDNGYVPNHYNKAKALQKLDRMEEAMPIFQAVMQMDGRKSASAAENAVRDHFVFIASSALNSNNANPSRSDAQRALDSLDEMEGYVEADADVYYYRAEALKVIGDYAKAVEMADMALEMHRGSRTDKAKIYFVKGEAHMLSGSSQDAKDAFSNALFGNYKALAQHYLDELNSSGE